VIESEYAPFPEAELKALVLWHEQAAAVWKADTKMQRDHLRRAKAVQDALAGHEALRTRFLEQSMTVRALQAENVA
jgi:hypothetical protein